MIHRAEYIKKLIDFKDKSLIKVVTGIRRCGKSTLLEMFKNHLIETGASADRIIFINFEDMKNSALTDVNALHAHVTARLLPGAMNYIFFDEIQLVPNFERAVNSLFLNKNVDLYLTGSNAYMLSGEIATLLSGRYVEIEMLPISFKEYISVVGRAETRQKYSEYVRGSSFPYTLELGGNIDRIGEYLGGIYSTVILKDIVARKKITDVMMLESVVRFVFDNIGSLLSIKKIADTMTSAGRKISTHTVESYLSALADCFVIYRASRYDVKGRQYLKTNDKFYACDMGLRSWLLGQKIGDIGHVLENIIYLELTRRNKNVYVGKIGDGEIDFVAMKNGLPEYYQVAATVRDEKVLERELKPLRDTHDSYPKFLLTLDEDPPADHYGIKQVNAIDFLLE